MSSSKRAFRRFLTRMVALVSAGVLAATLLTPQSTVSAARPDIPLADFELYSNDNLVLNPGFEQVSDGWPDDWDPWNSQSSNLISSSTERAHGGTRSIRIDDPDPQLGLGARSAKTPVIAEKRYTASAYVYNESGSVHLYIEYWNASGQRISVASEAASGQGDWNQVSVHADAPAAATHASVLLYSVTTNTGVSFVDDMHLMPTAAATDFPNAGFETVDGSWPPNWTPWNAESSSQIESTTDRAHSGSRSVRITDPNSSVGVGLRSQKVPVDPGQRYSASAYTYVESGSIDLYIEFWNASGQRIDTAHRGTSNQGSWVEARTAAYAPANATHATVLPYANSSNVGEVYVDDVSFYSSDPLDGSRLLPEAPHIDEVSVTDRFASQGNYSMHLQGRQFDTEQGKIWPRVHLTPSSVLPAVNWSQRDYLRVGAVNASMQPARLHVMAWDRNDKRHDVVLQADPFEYKVFQIKTSDIAASGLDLSRVGVWVFIERSQHPTDMYVDDLRLTDTPVNVPAEQARVAPALVDLMDLPGMLDERWDALDAAQGNIGSGSAEPETTLRAAADDVEGQLEAFASQAGCQRTGTDMTCADPAPLRNDPGAARSVLLGADELRWDIARLAGKVDARVASPSSPVGFGFSDSMSRVYPRDLPCDCEFTRGTGLDMVRGEHESTQLVAVPYSNGLTNAQVQASVTSGPSGGLSADAHPVASLNLVPPVHQPPAQPTEFRPSIYEGWTPDPIQTDRDAVNVAAGDLQAYWVSLETTTAAAPGDYTVELTFTANGVTAQTSTITVTVHDAQIGDEPELRTAIGHAPHAYAAVYGVTDPEEIDQLIEEEYEFLGQYWLQGDNIYRYVENTPPSVDRLQRIDQQYGGLRQFAVWTFRSELYDPNGSVAGWNAQADEMFDLIQPYVDQYRTAGLIDKAYLYCCDEMGTAGETQVAKHVLTRFKQRFPDVKVLTTAIDDNMGRSNGLDELIDWWVQDVPWHNQEIIDERHNAGQEAWWYLHAGNDNPTPNVFVNYDAGPLRTTLGPMSHQADIDGFLYYLVDRWLDKPILDDGPLSSWEPRTFYNWAGDGSLMYPGPDGPIPSIRLENIRDGLEDYNLLAELRRAIDNAPGGTDPALIDQAEHLVGATDVVTDNYDYTNDPDTYRTWRADVADVLDQLT